jgi:hypothetical protein
LHSYTHTHTHTYTHTYTHTLTHTHTLSAKPKGDAKKSQEEIARLKLEVEVAQLKTKLAAGPTGDAAKKMVATATADSASSDPPPPDYNKLASRAVEKAAQNSAAKEQASMEKE